MTGSAKFLLVATLALVVPLILLFVDARSGSLAEVVAYAPMNCLMMTLPQLLVVVLALLFPALRSRFAIAALLSLTALVLLFGWVIFFGPDSNGAMLWAFYFPFSAAVLITVALTVGVRGRVRGSNNRWRGP